MAGRKSKSHKAQKTGGKPRLAPNTRLSGNPPSADAPAATDPQNLVNALMKPDDGRPTADEKAGVEDQSIPQEDPKKQWWYRVPNSKSRKLAEKIAILDARLMDDASIAKKLGIKESTVAQTRYIARKNGWWDVDDNPIDLETELALTIDRKIVRNISAALDGQMTNWQNHEMTIAAAKGRGIFKNHEKASVEHKQLTPVAIQIVMPPLAESQQRVEIPEHMVGGVPAYEEGQIVEHPVLPPASSEQ